jgi:hypothetical protein
MDSALTRHPGLDPGSTFSHSGQEGGCRIKSGMTSSEDMP